MDDAATNALGVVDGTIPAIAKRAGGVAWNLHDYSAALQSFEWKTAAQLEGLADGGLNIAYEAVDRHARGAAAKGVALRFLPKDGDSVVITFEDLARMTGRFAGVLDAYGVPRGAVVCTLLGRCPELYAGVLGTLKHAAVLCLLFSAFEPEPIRQRLTRSSAKVLLTTAPLYRAKVAAMRDSLPDLEFVFVVGGGAEPPETIDLTAAMAAARPTDECAHTAEDSKSRSSVQG